jgi:type IV pilus assembly protein PilB
MTRTGMWGGQVQLLRPPGAKIWCSRCTPHRGAIGSEGSARQEVSLARKPRQKLGEILIGLGVVTLAQVDEAFAAARARGMRLGEILVETNACKEEDIAKALAQQFSVDFINLDVVSDMNKIDKARIPADLIKKFLVLPMAGSGKLRLIIHDPMDIDTLEMLRFRVGEFEQAGIASKRQITSYINGGAKAEGPPRKQLAGDSMDKSVDKSVDKSLDRSAKSIDVDDDGPIRRLVARIILDAVNGRASDIHIEPAEGHIMLRYRIDGVCVEIEKLQKNLQNAVLSTIKLMAGVNIAERRIPQDGRIKFPVPEIDQMGDPVYKDGQPVINQIDFRVSTCPAFYGESVVLRILRPDSVRIGLLNLGFEQDSLDVFNKIIRRPNGIFLVTGPTGSGKTTTLYSALAILNTPDRKIITAEDPVEYNFNGINQVQIREQIGLTFGIVLKSMLRQAPNIILIGEIRDREVADIAIQAALTGHLVFSTLHTNDAPSAITRLVDMGVKPFLVASSIQAVLAQRLGRVLCPMCKMLDDAPDPKFLKLVDIAPEEAMGKVMKAVGCPNCKGTGYRGRKAIFEMMIMNSEIRELAFQRAGVSKLRAAAVRGGMRSLLGDGRIKILKGVTTPDEVAKYAQIEGFDPSEVTKR